MPLLTVDGYTTITGLGTGKMKNQRRSVDRGLPQPWDNVLTLCNNVVQRLNQRLYKDVGLSFSQYQFLAVVHGYDRITLGQVAEALSCTRGNITGRAERLTQQGLLSRQNHPDDRRSVYVQLTPQGRSWLENARKAVEAELLLMAGTSEFSAFAELARQLIGSEAENDASLAPGAVSRSVSPLTPNKSVVVVRKDRVVRINNVQSN